MKKLLIFLLIVVILAGVVFFFGWVQIQLGENEYAVIFTKTRGWDTHVTKPGSFAWRWERLIPTNLTLHVYDITPQFKSFGYDGTLPSGQLYASMLDPAPDFSYSVEFGISYTLSVDSLPDLAADKHILPENLEEYYRQIGDALGTKASVELNRLAGDESFSSQLAVVSPEVGAILADRLQSSFPEVTINEIVPVEVSLPDIELYRISKEQYLTMARNREQSRLDTVEQVVQTEQRAQQHFSILERYGRLLSEYPVLMDLFTLKEGRLDQLLTEIEGLDVE